MKKRILNKENCKDHIDVVEIDLNKKVDFKCKLKKYINTSSNLSVTSSIYEINHKDYEEGFDECYFRLSKREINKVKNGAIVHINLKIPQRPTLYYYGISKYIAMICCESGKYSIAFNGDEDEIKKIEEVLIQKQELIKLNDMFEKLLIKEAVLLKLEKRNEKLEEGIIKLSNNVNSIGSRNEDTIRSREE